MINDNVRQILVGIPSAWGDGNVQGHVLFVDWLINEMQPKVTVDLGIDYGYSLIALAHNNPGKVYGIDGNLLTPRCWHFFLALPPFISGGFKYEVQR